MGLFSRRQPQWQPPTPSHCSCVRHLDGPLLDAVVPLSAAMQEYASEMEPMTIRALLEMQALSVRPTAPEDLRVSDSSSTFTWDMWAGDEVRGHYDDDAELGLGVALAAQPGIDEVAWMDREVLLLSAPTLCADGVLATAAVVLLDDRVRAKAD